jgi:Di-haem oxidoreductase, putative peroxidase
MLDAFRCNKLNGDYGCRFAFGKLICAAWILSCNCAFAQQNYRPGTASSDPIEFPRDLSGYSVRSPRIRLLHTLDPQLPGGSMYLQQVDPWLGYLWGRELLQREFSLGQGVFGEPSKPDGILLPDGATHMTNRDHVSSCLACHNTPYRDAGAGITIPKNGGTGRNTPHLFGAGLLEMLGAELRLAAYRIADNRDGWIDLVEAKDKRMLYQTLPSTLGNSDDSCELELRGGNLDYGRFDDHNLDGVPDLNPIFYVIYVDSQGDRIPWAGKLTEAGVKGYRLEVQVFGHSQLRVANRPPLSGTLRAFTTSAFDIHQGLQAFDPTTLNEVGRSGVSGVSNAGCVQFVSSSGRDRGRTQNAHGVSQDDPDRDGVCHELTEGDLDVAEWYLLNHPRPARGRSTRATQRGEQLFTTIGCASCHTRDWHIPAQNLDATDYTLRHRGDRRLFDLEACYDDQRRAMIGRLRMLTETAVFHQSPTDEDLSATHAENRLIVPRSSEFVVRDLFSDLKYHDLGEAFHQLQFDGTVIRMFRTTPLWGVGSTAPYSHDGADLDLSSVIERHGGEATEVREAFRALSEEDQQAILAFLRSLVLYQTDQLPCDIDGDGRISNDYLVDGASVGIETFRPEWLLRVPCKIEGELVNVLGSKIVSRAVTNVRAAYGLDLDYIRDEDEDGWPDLQMK